MYCVICTPGHCVTLSVLVGQATSLALPECDQLRQPPGLPVGWAAAPGCDVSRPTCTGVLGQRLIAGTKYDELSASRVSGAKAQCSWVLSMRHTVADVPC